MNNKENPAPTPSTNNRLLAAVFGVVGVLAVLGIMVFRSKTASPTDTPPPTVVSGDAAKPAVAGMPPKGAEAASGQSGQLERISVVSKTNPAKDPLANVSVADLLKSLKDPAISPADRKAVIHELARIGSPEALAGLKEALATGTEDIRVAVAESLGACASPDCFALLNSLLNDPNDKIVQAAIRGLGELGTTEAAAVLGQVLNNSVRSVDVRAEAALSLGKIEQPGVVDTLSQAAMTIPDNSVVTSILNALGNRDFSETQSFYQNYIHGANTTPEMAVAAVESLWQAKGDPTSFLTGLVSDQNSDIRVAAAWALSATETTGNSGPQLMALLQSESDPDVRLRIYQALGNQANFDVAAALADVQNEKDPGARLAGLNLLARTLRDNPSPALQTFFDQTATAELQQTALTSDVSDNRMKAVLALIRANTPGSIAALGDLATASTDPRVKETANRIIGLANRP